MFKNRCRLKSNQELSFLAHYEGKLEEKVKIQNTPNLKDMNNSSTEDLPKCPQVVSTVIASSISFLRIGRGSENSKHAKLERHE